jgi:hypothetical protein
MHEPQNKGQEQPTVQHIPIAAERPAVPAEIVALPQAAAEVHR